MPCPCPCTTSILKHSTCCKLATHYARGLSTRHVPRRLHRPCPYTANMSWHSSFCVLMTTGDSVCRPIGCAIGSDVRSKRKHTDAFATETGSRKGGSRRVHAKQYAHNGVTLLEPLYNAGRSDQTGRVLFTPILPDTHSSGSFR